jgi:hypothetical protein
VPVGTRRGAAPMLAPTIRGSADAAGCGAAASAGGPEQLQSAPLQQGREAGGRTRFGVASGAGAAGFGAGRTWSGQVTEDHDGFGPVAGAWPRSCSFAEATPAPQTAKAETAMVTSQRARQDFMPPH